MTKTQIRSQKYAVIKNAYQNSKLAAKARDWSWDRIYKELALKKPTNRTLKKVQVKKYHPKTVARKKRQLKNITYMKAYYFPIEDIRENKSKSKAKIQDLLKDIKIGEKRVRVYAGRDSQSEKYGIWAYWSKKNTNNFPGALLKMAHNINRERGLDINHKFGFFVIYEMYYDNLSLEDALKVANPDPYSDAIIYKTERRFA